MGLGNKEIMAKNIKRQMDKKGVNASIVCSDLNIPMATFSDWYNAKTYPRIDKIEMLANYFGVSKAELVEFNNSTPITRKEFFEILFLGFPKVKPLEDFDEFDVERAKTIAARYLQATPKERKIVDQILEIDNKKES